MPRFLGRKSRGAFGQPAFFLAGYRMTTVAFEKEVFSKPLRGIPCKNRPGDFRRKKISFIFSAEV